MTKLSEFSAETKPFTNLPYLTYKNNNMNQEFLAVTFKKNH